MIDNFNLFIKNANAVIFAVDRELRVCEWNTKCTEVSGFSRNEVIGTLLDSIVPALYQGQVQSTMNNALARKETSLFRMEINTKGGEVATLLMSATTQWSDMLTKGQESPDHVAGVVCVGSFVSDEDEDVGSTFALLGTGTTRQHNVREALEPIREVRLIGFDPLSSIFDKRDYIVSEWSTSTSSSISY